MSNNIFSFKCRCPKGNIVQTAGMIVVVENERWCRGCRYKQNDNNVAMFFVGDDSSYGEFAEGEKT